MIDIFLIPLLLCIVLVTIHTWFGEGILERGIIFTDLSIAQAAALGSAVSLGYWHGEYLMISTFAFALGTGIIIAYAQTRTLHLEAFIGLLYVLSASGIMMVLSHSAEGMEHFKSLLANDILFTTSAQLYQAFGFYLFIALAILFIYPRTNGFVKELLFFTLLSLTVTSSVQLAGVLVVFVLLIAPILVASMQDRYAPYPLALLFGWIISTLSIGIAFYADLPTGYTMVFITAAIALISVLILSTKKRGEVL
jgi:zinc/manganese transport system permease protein